MLDKTEICNMTARDAEVQQMKDDHASRFADKRAWFIVEVAEGYQVHEWVPDGLWPYTTYPTKRLAAARILQLLGIGPVAPQSHPERIEINFIENDHG